MKKILITLSFNKVLALKLFIQNYSCKYLHTLNKFIINATNLKKNSNITPERETFIKFNFQQIFRNDRF